MQTKEKTFFALGDPFFKYNFDTVIIMVFLLCASFFQNGTVAVLNAAVCVFSACVSEYLSFRFILKKEKPLSDLNAVLLGFLVALLLPACVPPFVGASACAFAVLVCKLPFGSAKNAPFVPAAAAICFVSLCFPEYVFSYPASSEMSKVIFSSSPDFVKGESLLEMLSLGTGLRPNAFSLTALLSGAYPASSGTSCILLLVAAAVFIGIRRPKQLVPFAGFILSCAAFAFFFPRIGSGRIISVITELCAGSLFFTALFLINDPITSPKKSFHAFIYGAAAGIICMLLRTFFKNIDAGCLAVMFSNAFLTVFENREKKPRFKKAAGRESA